MPGEAQKAFEYLQENIPTWLESLEAIRARLVAKQDEIQKIAIPVTPSIRRKRSGSMESLRPDDIAVPSSAHQQSSPVQPQTATVTASPAAKRKRNTASLISGRLSGALKYRSRRMVVVYYDSEIQKSFETLVRNIGIGRNLLRKGKMAAKMDALSASIPGDSDDSSSTSSDGADQVLSKIGYRPKMTNFRMTRSPRSALEPLRNAETAGDNYDTADKDLEKAQGLCERGAHQYLRDGDCMPELDSCKIFFTQVLGLSEALNASNKAKEQEAAARQQQIEQEKKDSQMFQHTSVSLLTAEISPSEEKRISYHRPDPLELEVDDDEEEDQDEPVLIRPFRAPYRMTSRT